MKNLLLILSLSTSFVLTGCAQTKTSVQSTYAFFRTFIPGNLPVDDNGNPLRGPYPVRIIYIETRGPATPQIESVQHGDNMFSASVFAEEKVPVVVGIGKASGKTVVINPRKGHKLWRIELTPTTEMRRSASNKITVTGMLSGKKFTRIISKETELKPEIRV
jgi:hypothetical protein